MPRRQPVLVFTPGRLAVAQFVVIAVLGVTNFYLTRTVSSLKSEVRRMRADQVLAEGTQLPPLEARDLAGKPVTVAYTGRLPTVIYVFSPDCAWCRRNKDSIAALADKSEQAYQFVGVSMSRKGLDAYLARHRAPFPLYVDIDPSTTILYRLGATPQTMVVAPGGRLVKVWNGAFLGNVKRDIERFFQHSLPEPRAEEVVSR